MSFGGVDEQKLANAAADRLPAILSAFLADFKAAVREVLDDERTVEITIKIGGKKP